MPRTTGTISERPNRTDLPGSRSANEIPEFDIVSEIYDSGIGSMTHERAFDIPELRAVESIIESSRSPGRTISNNAEGTIFSNDNIMTSDCPITGRASSINFTDTFIRNKLSDFRREYNTFPEHIIANPRTIASINRVFMETYHNLITSAMGEQTRIYGLVPIPNTKYADGKFVIC